jgi:dihydrodipicolinate synthase/N-acetylneuraminate lyase
MSPKVMTRESLRGIWCTVLLPIEADDGIDFGRMAADLDYLIAQQPHGVYVNGTAGELDTLTDDEFDRIAEVVAHRCAGAGVAYQIGASHPSGQVACRRVVRAAAVTPAAIQVTLPDWTPLHDDEVRRAIARLHELADPVPIVLYNPPHAKTQLDAQAFGRLADEFTNLVGVKVRGGDRRWHAALRAGAADLAVFVPGHELGHQRKWGANGSYSNVACMSPDGALRWFAAMDADPLAADDLQRRLDEFFAATMAPLADGGLSGVALDKLLAAVGGWSLAGLRVRWPRTAAPESVVEHVRALARQAVPELLPRG